MTETWVPPTIKDIEAYIDEHDLTVDSRRFYNYYSRSGFTYRGLPMDWKAQLEKWSSTEYKRASSAPKPAAAKEHFWTPEEFQGALARLKRAIDNHEI